MGRDCGGARRSEWQRLAGALLLLGGASRKLRASERERAEKTKKKLLAYDAAAILRPLSGSRLRAAVPPPDEKAAAPWPASVREQAATLLPGKRASELPSRRRSRA